MKEEEEGKKKKNNFDELIFQAQRKKLERGEGAGEQERQIRDKKKQETNDGPKSDDHEMSAIDHLRIRRGHIWIPTAGRELNKEDLNWMIVGRAEEQKARRIKDLEGTIKASVL